MSASKAYHQLCIPVDDVSIQVVLLAKLQSSLPFLHTDCLMHKLLSLDCPNAKQPGICIDLAAVLPAGQRLEHLKEVLAEVPQI